MTKQQIEGGAAQVLASANAETDPVKKFCAMWTGIVRPILELAKTVTGPKIDAQINALETAADNVCAGTNPDVQNFCTIWHTSHMESVLRIVEVFVGKNAKKAINTFIDVADSLCGQ